jgi:hypothetical protein
MCTTQQTVWASNAQSNCQALGMRCELLRSKGLGAVEQCCSAETPTAELTVAKGSTVSEYTRWEQWGQLSTTYMWAALLCAISKPCSASCA